MAKKIIAMILAGGKGTRLEALTKKNAKPAVSFAAKYRIIDFPLSNCANSGINTVGVLTQYESTFLETYLGNGEKWGLNGVHSLLAALPPKQTEEGASWYKGTADAIYRNIDFIDEQNPEHVLILSGDHIYKTTYSDMIELHINSGADITISCLEVDIKEASRFGIMSTDETDQIIEFQEKPAKPKSNLASMGIYVFKWKVLRKYLLEDAENPDSVHDFGKNIIPRMLKDNKKMQAYRFKGYWKDVGTIASLHQANMDIALGDKTFDLYNEDFSTRIYSEDKNSVPQYVGTVGSIKQSIANQGSIILGDVDTCVISSDAVIEEDAVCKNCVIMEGARIKQRAKVYNAIITAGTVIEEDEQINLNSEEIVLISRKAN